MMDTNCKIYIHKCAKVTASKVLYNCQILNSDDAESDSGLYDCQSEILISDGAESDSKKQPV